MASTSTTPNTNQAAEGDVSAEERAIINDFEEGRLCAAEALTIEPVSEHEGEEGHEGEERHETMSKIPGFVRKNWIWARNCSKFDITVYVSHTRPMRIPTSFNITAGMAEAGLGAGSTLWPRETLVKSLSHDPSHKAHEYGHKPNDPKPFQRCPEARFRWEYSRNAFISVSPGDDEYILKNEEVEPGSVAEFHGDSNLTIFNSKGIDVTPPPYHVTT